MLGWWKKLLLASRGEAQERNILEKYFIIPWFLNKIIFHVMMGDGLRAVLCGGKKKTPYLILSLLRS